MLAHDRKVFNQQLFRFIIIQSTLENSQQLIFNNSDHRKVHQVFGFLVEIVETVINCN